MTTADAIIADVIGAVRDKLGEREFDGLWKRVPDAERARTLSDLRRKINNRLEQEQE